MQDGPLSNRYEVISKDGRPIPEGQRYFVLSPDTDHSALLALIAYVSAVSFTHPQLALSIMEEYNLAGREHILDLHDMPR